MSRRKSYKIFDIDYLLNEELSEDDLYWLFETPSLSYSLVLEMFRTTKQPLSDEKKIISLIKKDKDWMYKYFWTDKQRENFTSIVKNVYKNINYYNDKEAQQNADWWIVQYGLSNINLKDKKNISKLCE